MRHLIIFLFLIFGSANAADTIKIVVPFAPGGPIDQAARILEKTLTTRTPYNYVVESRLGAGGVIAATHVAKLRGSETVLLMHSLAFIVNSLGTNPGYALNDFEPVASLGSVQLALVSNPNSKINTIKKLLATKDPVFFGSGGIGSATHTAGETFGKETGVNMIHVPYKGDTPVITDTLNGSLGASFIAVSVVPKNQLTVLAVTGLKRAKDFPNAPTLHELGVKNFDASQQWFVLLANTTADQRILTTIKNALMTELQENPDLFAQAGVETNKQNLFNTQQFLLNEQQRMRKILIKD